MVAHARGVWRDTFRSEFVQIIGDSPSLAEAVLNAHLCLAEFSLYGPAPHEETEAFARELLGMADGRGSAIGAAMATLMLGEVELLSGRLDEAEGELALAADLAARSGGSSVQAMATERLGEVAVARNDRRRASKLLREARGLALASPLVSHLLVRVHGARIQAAGSPTGAAARAVEAADADLEGRDVCDPCSIGFLTAAAIASARAGRVEPARRYLADAERVSGMWQGGAWPAAVWEARAHLRLADDDPLRAAALFREAAEAFARAGHPLAEARCRAAAESADSDAAPRNGSGTRGR